jgi:hypothetical protein
LDDGVEILYYDMAMVVVVAVEEGRSEMVSVDVDAVDCSSKNGGKTIWRRGLL